MFGKFLLCFDWLFEILKLFFLYILMVVFFVFLVEWLFIVLLFLRILIFFMVLLMIFGLVNIILILVMISFLFDGWCFMVGIFMFRFVKRLNCCLLWSLIGVFFCKFWDGFEIFGDLIFDWFLLSDMFG